MPLPYEGRRGFAGGAVLLLLLAFATPAPAVLNFPVDSTADEPDAVPGDGLCDSNPSGDCTLRAAIQEANAQAQPILISLSDREYTLSRSGADDDATAGDLDVTNPEVVVEGAGTDETIVRSIVGDRVFDVRGTGGLVLNALTVQEGMADRGGCVRNLGTLLVTHVRLTECLASFGGGLYHDGASLTVLHTTIAWNAGQNGGGAAMFEPGRFDRTLIHDNQAEYGGGIFAGANGEIDMVNSTVSGNRAKESGGGISLSETSHIRSSTIADNVAGEEGGGIVDVFRDATIRVGNSIVAGNAAATGPECAGTLVLDGGNLVQDATGCTLAGNLAGALTGVSPELAPLADNGGAVWTRALASTSPAVDAGDPAGCTDTDGVPLDGDGRNRVRAVDGRCTGGDARCDLGAYERESARDDDGDGAIFAGCEGGTDCDDAAAAVRPGVLDVCDGVDDDCSGAADDALGCTPVAGAMLDVRDRNPRSLAFRGRRPKLPLAAAGEAADPTCREGGAGGALLDVFGLDDSGQAASLVLPCAGWTATTRGRRVVGYVYRDPKLENGPCRVVKLSRAGVTAKCTGALAYDLDGGERAVGVVLTVGATTPAAGARQYCARFERRSVKRDDDLRFLARGAPAPAVCPVP